MLYLNYEFMDILSEHTKDKTFFIAEIGINHNGNIDIALELIQAAKYAGCNAVKFQKRYPEICVPKSQWEVIKETPWGEMRYIDYKNKIELTKEDFNKIDKLCKSLDIIWFASCWDQESVNFIEEFNPPIYKIASASLTDKYLIEYLDNLNKSLILSTGMSSEDEIKVAVDNISKSELAILHCNSSYPSNYEDINLKYILKLKELYPKNIIGYSGHELGLSPSIAAVVLGAKIIERHITLDKSMWGTDQKSSIEPLGFARLIRDTRIIEKSLGKKNKIVSKEELKMKLKLRNL